MAVDWWLLLNHLLVWCDVTGNNSFVSISECMAGAHWQHEDLSFHKASLFTKFYDHLLHSFCSLITIPTEINLFVTQWANGRWFWNVARNWTALWISEEPKNLLFQSNKLLSMKRFMNHEYIIFMIRIFHFS